MPARWRAASGLAWPMRRQYPFRCGTRPATALGLRRAFSAQSGESLVAESLSYKVMRGAGFLSRVVLGMPWFFRYLDNEIFADGTSDIERSAMFAFSQFPRKTHVELEGFLQSAERVALTVFEHMYAAPGPDTEEYVGRVAAPECVAVLGRKPTSLLHHLLPLSTPSGASRLVLEQLTINRVSLAAVEYSRRPLTAAQMLTRRDRAAEQEWLALSVQYEAMEHLQVVSVDGAGIDDRHAVRTTFEWTFESEVTRPDELDWVIAHASPFSESLTMLNASSVRQ